MLFCSQNCSLFIRIQSFLFKSSFGPTKQALCIRFQKYIFKHKLLDGKEKKELTCTLSGKACSKLMLD